MQKYFNFYYLEIKQKSYEHRNYTTLFIRIKIIKTETTLICKSLEITTTKNARQKYISKFFRIENITKLFYGSKYSSVRFNFSPISSLRLDRNALHLFARAVKARPPNIGLTCIFVPAGLGVVFAPKAQR